jgi:hypothetical protein
LVGKFNNCNNNNLCGPEEMMSSYFCAKNASAPVINVYDNNKGLVVLIAQSSNTKQRADYAVAKYGI